MGMDRRGFLKAILAAGMAPAIVKAESLMRLHVLRQELIFPTNGMAILYGDGIHDDTLALQTWIDGGAVMRPDGTSFHDGVLSGERLLISNTIILDGMNGRVIQSCDIKAEGLGGKPAMRLNSHRWELPVLNSSFMLL